MATFKVLVSETIGGSALIEADSIEAAEEKAKQILDDEGIAGFKGFDTAHRETLLIDCEEEE